MPNPTYQLIADNWELFYFETVSRPSAFPLPVENWTFSPSLQSEAELLAIYAETPSGRESWKFAGYLNLKFPTGLTVGGLTDAESSISRPIPLNRITLFPVQKFSSSYGLEMSVPHWIPDIALNIWEYTGEIIYPEIALLNEINAKT
jgi:hypothetical protein